MFITNIDLLIILTAIATVVMAFVYVYMAMNKVFKKEQELSAEENQMRTKAGRILEHAQEKAMYIVETATQKSKQILDHTEVLKQNLDKEAVDTFKNSVKNYGSILDKEATDIKNAYKLKVEDMKNQYLSASKAIMEAFNQAGQQNLQEMRKALSDEKLSSTAYLRSKVDAEWELAHKQIQAYKQEQMQQMSQTIKDHIKRISVEVLGSHISLDDQERLIMEALAQAKKEHIFTF